MSRARNIKPGFFKNELLAEMPCETRLLFVGLWTLADREGRLEDRPKRIKAELFAFDSFDVDSMLNRLQSDEFITRYEADGKRFIQIENFVKHQDPHYKEKASEIPPPPGRENLILATGVTRVQRARILERDEYTCASCGSKEHLCIDHILPVSRGGDSSDENLQTLCLSCNTKKGNKLDGETKNKTKKAATNLPGPEDGATSSRTQINESARSPLIPDSLIPDSLIPDSLIPESGTNPPATAPASVREGNFAMDLDWQPSEHFPTLARQAGVMGGCSPEALAEFRSYWFGQPTMVRTQHQWDHALLTSLKANKLRSQQPSPINGKARSPPINGATRQERAAAQTRASFARLAAEVRAEDDGRTIDAGE